MTPGKVDFVCPQGATFSKTLTYKIEDSAVNLTGYTSGLQIREYHYSDSYIASLTQLSGITLGGSAGTIDVQLHANKVVFIRKLSDELEWRVRAIPFRFDSRIIKMPERLPMRRDL